MLYGCIFAFHTSRMAMLGNVRVPSRFESTLPAATEALIENLRPGLSGRWLV